MQAELLDWYINKIRMNIHYWMTQLSKEERKIKSHLEEEFPQVWWYNIILTR